MNSRKRLERASLPVIVVLGLLLALLLAAAPIGAAQADRAPNPLFLPPDGPYYGKTYGEWSAAWWQWAFGTPYSQSAWSDDTGARCGAGQAGPVWFLAGVANASGTVERNCTVPAGKALFMPVLNVEWDNEGVKKPYTVDELRAIAAGIIDHTAGLYVQVDGVALSEAELKEAYRTTSPVFYYTMSATDNSYGLTCTGNRTPVCRDGSGAIVPFADLTWTTGSRSTVTAVSVGDGYYVMLAPLPLGRHTVHFGGTFTDWNYTLDILYHLNVKP